VHGGSHDKLSVERLCACGPPRASSTEVEGGLRRGTRHTRAGAPPHHHTSPPHGVTPSPRLHGLYSDAPARYRYPARSPGGRYCGRGLCDAEDTGAAGCGPRCGVSHAQREPRGAIVGAVAAPLSSTHGPSTASDGRLTGVAADLVRPCPPRTRTYTAHTYVSGERGFNEQVGGRGDGARGFSATGP
jgi:hypothetical protein